MTSIRSCLVAAGMFIVFGTNPALAATHVWQGPSSGGLWSNAANWSNGLPTTGEAGGTIVQFGSSTSTTMNIAGLTVDQLHFTGTGDTVLASGSTALGVSGSQLVTNILDDAGGNAVAAPLTLSGAVIIASVAAGTLTLSGSIGGAVGLQVSGTGTSGVTLTGTSNTYTGTTTVAAGTLNLNSNGVNTAVTDPRIVVGTSASAATLKLQQSAEIADSTDIQIGASGTFDVNSFSESIHGITTTDGTVAIGTGSLLVGGPLSMTGGSITGTSPGALRLLADVSATSSATSTATISAPVTLNGARTFTIADGPQSIDLSIANAIGDGLSASSLTKAGAGAMSITGATGNTYTGDTTVQAGLLATSHATGVGIPANVTIGTGAGGPSSATLRLDQSSELSPTGTVTVQQDGLFDLSAHTQTVAALTVHGGAVTIGAGSISVSGTVAMTGGRIDSTSTGRLTLGGDVTATSSAQGSATISAHTVLTGDRTFTVTPGTAPELTVSGVIGEQGAPRALTKAGSGTLLSTADHTYTGLTTVAGGRFVARGQQSGPFSVGAAGTLAGNGAVGATTVTGALAPEDGLRTGALSFGPGGQLVVGITSADPALAPTILVTGAVSIDPAAILTTTIAPGLTLPGGRALPLIANDGADPITGTFGTAHPSTPEGVPLVPTYTAVDGNDLALVATNVAPVVGAVSVSPATGAVGQAFALGVGATDLNNDTLTTTWDFGDGTHGTGASTSHTYATAGTFHVVATVSDGTAQGTAAAYITVTQPAGGGGLTGNASVSARATARSSPCRRREPASRRAHASLPPWSSSMSRARSTGSRASAERCSPPAASRRRSIARRRTACRSCSRRRRLRARPARSLSAPSSRSRTGHTRRRS